MRLQQHYLGVTYDIFANLASGWFAAMLIVPDYKNLATTPNLINLLINLGFGILCVAIAFKLHILVYDPT